MHAGIGIGARDRLLQFGRQFGIDRVQRLGPVERDAGDPPVTFVEYARHDGLPSGNPAKPCSMQASGRYAFVRIPANSISCYASVMNPVLEDALVAIATTVGAWLFAQQLGALLFG